jgi:hypothetical protein
LLGTQSFSNSINPARRTRLRRGNREFFRIRERKLKRYFKVQDEEPILPITWYFEFEEEDPTRQVDVCGEQGHLILPPKVQKGKQKDHILLVLQCHLAYEMALGAPSPIY